MNKQVEKFLLLNLGLILVAVGIALFKTPNHFAIGGTSGYSILIASFFENVNVSVVMLFVNLILVILGFVFIGKSFIGYTVYSSFAMSFYVWVIEFVFPLSAPLTNDTLLELLFAVMLPGIGTAIAFNVGASTGGTDIISMILSKYTNISIGISLLITDLFVTVAAGFIFGVQTGLYCILGLFLKTFLVDIAIEMINSRKYLTIISNQHENIQEYIINTLKRSANISYSYGAYTLDEHVVLTTVLSSRQAVALKQYIKSIDPKAFITIVNSSETIGKGFRRM